MSELSQEVLRRVVDGAQAGKDGWWLAQDNALTHLMHARLAVNRAWRRIKNGTSGPLTISDLRNAQRQLNWFFEEYAKIDPSSAEPN